MACCHHCSVFFRIRLWTAVFFGTLFFLTFRLFLPALYAFLLHLVEHSASTSAIAIPFKEPKSLGLLVVETVCSESWLVVPSDAMVEKPDSKGWSAVLSPWAYDELLNSTLHLSYEMSGFCLLSAILCIVSAHKYSTVGLS